MEYERIVSKKTPPYNYMRVQLSRPFKLHRVNYPSIPSEFDTDEPPAMEAAQFKALILYAINTLFGEVGQATIHTDILQYRQGKRTALLRVNSSEFVKLWGALTLCGEYAGQPCAFRIMQVSSSLMALAENSRTFTHKPVPVTTDR